LGGRLRSEQTPHRIWRSLPGFTAAKRAAHRWQRQKLQRNQSNHDESRKGRALAPLRGGQARLRLACPCCAGPAQMRGILQLSGDRDARQLGELRQAQRLPQVPPDRWKVRIFAKLRVIKLAFTAPTVASNRQPRAASASRWRNRRWHCDEHTEPRPRAMDSGGLWTANLRLRLRLPAHRPWTTRP